jgi:hypothetical protein
MLSLAGVLIGVGAVLVGIGGVGMSRHPWRLVRQAIRRRQGSLT